MRHFIPGSQLSVIPSPFHKGNLPKHCCSALQASSQVSPTTAAAHTCCSNLEETPSWSVHYRKYGDKILKVKKQSSVQSPTILSIKSLLGPFSYYATEQNNQNRNSRWNQRDFLRGGEVRLFCKAFGSVAIDNTQYFSHTVLRIYQKILNREHFIACRGLRPAMKQLC